MTVAPPQPRFVPWRVDGTSGLSGAGDALGLGAASARPLPHPFFAAPPQPGGAAGPRDAEGEPARREWARRLPPSVPSRPRPGLCSPDPVLSLAGQLSQGVCGRHGFIFSFPKAERAVGGAVHLLRFPGSPGALLPPPTCWPWRQNLRTRAGDCLGEGSEGHGEVRRKMGGEGRDCGVFVSSCFSRLCGLRSVAGKGWVRA